jgi:hypothetical protein
MSISVDMCGERKERDILPDGSLDVAHHPKVNVPKPVAFKSQQVPWMGVCTQIILSALDGFSG